MDLRRIEERSYFSIKTNYGVGTKKEKIRMVFFDIEYASDSVKWDEINGKMNENAGGGIVWKVLRVQILSIAKIFLSFSRLFRDF